MRSVQPSCDRSGITITERLVIESTVFNEQTQIFVPLGGKEHGRPIQTATAPNNYFTSPIICLMSSGKCCGGIVPTCDREGEWEIGDIEVPLTMWSQTRHVPSLEHNGLVTLQNMHNCIIQNMHVRAPLHPLNQKFY